MSEIRNSYQIKVTGLVQGVGFRPFIYRIAYQNSVKGWVENNLRGVIIEAEAEDFRIEKFILEITTKAPPAAFIEKVEVSKTAFRNFDTFEIRKSTDDNEGVTEISPDIAVCSDCLDDMKHQQNRINYPFTNCTNCGPRFTIIKDLPYDRYKTTMAVFEMCPDCRREYTDVHNRRFHAQPVACNHCGPRYELIVGNEHLTDFRSILDKTARLTEAGKIIAVKGLGGFHLMCDASNEATVSRLRMRKLREGKPFAVMFGNIGTIEPFAEIEASEKALLESWRRPIVLLKTKKALAHSVTDGFNRIGVMLPYMPFHHQLFDELKIPAIVLTSGNISDEPILLENEDAQVKLSGFADAFLVYNREIFNRTDDSVTFAVNNKTRLIRRSRGFVPSPIRTKLYLENIFAAGAELVNAFAVGKQNLAILSQHIGDLKNFETFEFYEETVKKFFGLFRVKPELVAVDLHPDYFSTRSGQNLGIKTVHIQHHHAHIASCMAEYGLDEKVIGVSFDGTGLGIDGHIWGGEFMICDLSDFRRYAHFEYIPMPGGDSVTKEPWRTALSYLYKTYGGDFRNTDLDFLKNIPTLKIGLITEALKKNINAPLSSSCGRLFDAVSALINLCPVSKFHAEAPMRLESVADWAVRDSYPFNFTDIISFRPTISSIVDDLKNHVSVPAISAKFHNTVVDVILSVTEKIRTETGINRVVLSGGSFQNAFLLGTSENLLAKKGFEVFSNTQVPANDGGIALGQLVIAAKRRSLGLD